MRRSVVLCLPLKLVFLGQRSEVMSDKDELKFRFKIAIFNFAAAVAGFVQTEIENKIATYFGDFIEFL
jgi:hypothetical protein